MTPIVKGTWLVKGIGGVLLPVLGQGTIDFTATIDGKQCPGRFKNVLFVPSLNANLISIGTAAKAGDCLDLHRRGRVQTVRVAFGVLRFKGL